MVIGILLLPLAQMPGDAVPVLHARHGGGARAAAAVREGQCYRVAVLCLPSYAAGVQPSARCKLTRRPRVNVAGQRAGCCRLYRIKVSTWTDWLTG